MDANSLIPRLNSHYGRQRRIGMENSRSNDDTRQGRNLYDLECLL